MSSSKMCTPTKTQVVMKPVNGTHDTSRFSILARSSETSNMSSGLMSPGAVSNGSAALQSPTSSRGSFSFLGQQKTGGVPVTPSKASNGDENQRSEQQNTSFTEKITRSLPASLHSSGHGHLLNQHGYSDGSPQKLMTRRLTHVQSLTIPEDTQVLHRRRSLPLEPSLNTPHSARRGSITTSLSTPTMQHSPHGAGASSMTGVPEPLAVQELAFRQGQHDSASTRDRIPSSPFAQHFNGMWEKSYRLGKTVGSTPFEYPPVMEPSHHNYEWPVLINPYTQSFEYPNGFVDPNWVRKMCEIGLNCMEVLIRNVCDRKPEWQKIICDVPIPVQDAILGFPDLNERYETLKHDAQEALSGGRPYGY